MTLIWIVQDCPQYYPAGGTGDILGVYSTKEAAETHVGKLPAKSRIYVSVETLRVLESCPESVTREVKRRDGSAYLTGLRLSDVDV